MAVLPAAGVSFDTVVPVVIVGAGACGLTAALAAADAGAEVLVLERDPVPQGSTALSSGMIPACGTRLQAEAGVEDSVEVMAADILAKAHGETDPALVRAVCAESGPAIDWLTETHGVELTLVGGFLYPGHSRLRMHAPPSRRGADLVGGLTRAAEAAGIPVLTNARVADLYADGEGRVAGLSFERPDGGVERVGCGALVLACNGYGGNRDLVRELIPDMAAANYFGHPGNRGDALLWGRDLGAATADLGAYQGHGSVAQPHGILITWALMMEGGIQVNGEGRRFSNEHEGYSEQARRVMAQPGGIAWNVYDDRLHALGREFDDYRAAEDAGALRRAETAAALAAACHLPAPALADTLADVERWAAGEGKDPFGRDFAARPPLRPPYWAVRVTGSLFHTQGGLVVDGGARVLRPDGRPLPNLFAGGGAARGVSGPADWGYLSGNGLLTAVALGRAAGRGAAALVT
ncbi:MAG: FAD-dependent oxidoreductase [Hyphomicrobiales bacterium]|nr:FAD-dependent oxidoreductase [Hyphomicrobiales bacterium]